tara:strand:+ start:49 stop:1833 length:1785 start_codon:yes stop_codon:yes gene_type:complete
MISFGQTNRQNDDKSFNVIDDMPEFPGGDLALMKFINKKVKYPGIAKRNNVTGKVYVSFIVDKDGSVTNVKIVRGVDKRLDAEALRVVSALPNYKPGKKNGKPTRVQFTIPINFSLNNFSSTDKLDSLNLVKFSPEFGHQHKCIYLGCSCTIKDRVKKIVEQSINKWQKKGEFETTNDYLLRVNDNRSFKIKKFQEIAIEKLKNEYLTSLNFKSLKLGDYDADNETFLLKGSSFDNLVISVPIEEAKFFKEDFSDYNFINPNCVIIDDKFVLSYVDIINSPFEYNYSLSSSHDYAITDIKYEFSPIEIDDIKSSNTTTSSNIRTNKINIGTSSVNINIPNNKKVKNRYALVIGNEDYTSFQRTLSSEQNVDYALNDATIFKEYCLKTFGVKEDNMFFLTDATAGTMHQEIDLITKIINKVGLKAELIVYYAGHGYPDELTKVPYLIPVDVSASNLSTAIKLDDLYQKLASTNASKITIFLDACFTGGGRNSGLVASRGVKVKPKEGLLDGNIVVFSASSAEESSLPYHDEAHGLFTYFLLKKFQESEGNITLGALSEYLDENVSIKSLRVNQKEQNPTVNTSERVANDWRNWKF